MVVKATPVAPFVMAQPEFLLQLLVVALDDPAVLGTMNEILEAGIGGQVGEPVLGGLGFGGRPFDQQPLSGKRSLSRPSRWVDRTRRAVKRDRSRWRVPFRQVNSVQSSGIRA